MLIEPKIVLMNLRIALGGGEIDERLIDGKLGNARSIKEFCLNVNC
jgi:hypothetical protein